MFVNDVNVIGVLFLTSAECCRFGGDSGAVEEESGCVVGDLRWKCSML